MEICGCPGKGFGNRFGDRKSPGRMYPGLAKILEAVSKGATLKTKAKLISVWRVRPHEGEAVFAPFGVALIAARKLNLSSPTEISDN